MAETDEIQQLRERLVEAIYAAGEKRNVSTHLADVVLAELRLSRVGVVSPDHEGYPRFSGTTPMTEGGEYERRCPVYRLDTPSWSRSALVPEAAHSGSSEPSGGALDIRSLGR